MTDVIVVQPMQWGAAPDISDVEPLSERDRECFRELRDVLKKYGCLDRFGVNLIHKHFPIGEDECLVETIDVQNRTLTVAPAKRGTVQQAIETQWRLADGSSYIVCDAQCVYNDGHAPRHYQRPSGS